MRENQNDQEGRLLLVFSFTVAITSFMVSLISPTWGCTSLMRSCSALENFSIRFPCSWSCCKRSFCLMEIRRIHQKQMPQHIRPTTVIQKATALRFIMHNSTISEMQKTEMRRPAHLRPAAENWLVQ